MPTYTYIRNTNCINMPDLCQRIHTLDKQIVSISRVYVNVYIHYIYKFYQSFGFMPTFTYKFYQYPGLGLGWVLTKVTNIPFPPRLIFQSRKIWRLPPYVLWGANPNWFCYTKEINCHAHTFYAEQDFSLKLPDYYIVHKGIWLLHEVSFYS